MLHPAISAGDGYSSLALRLYEPAPVPPERIVEWGVLPLAVMETLLDAVANRLRVLVVGGTGTGKTTLLSALCHGIPAESRIVKVEDPEEIWLPHPNVTTLEARPSPLGSDVPAYTVSDGVDDAMRLSPSHVIVVGFVGMRLRQGKSVSLPAAVAFYGGAVGVAVIQQLANGS